MRDFIYDNFGKIIVAMFVVLIGGLVWATYEEGDQWQTYATAHHCKPVGQKAASNGLGTDSKGQMVVTYNPSQTVYQCDGGEIQIR